MDIEEARHDVDSIDDEIIQLLGKRNKLVKEIARLKKSIDKDIYDPEREQQLALHIKQKAAIEGLDEAFVSSLFGVILDESKKTQKRHTGLR